jgi:cytochrome b561
VQEKKNERIKNNRGHKLPCKCKSTPLGECTDYYINAFFRCFYDSDLSTLAPWQYAALALHQSFGVLVLVLVDIRLLNKLRITVPELPSDLSKIQVFAAKGSHVLLYLGMLSLPIWAG